MCMNFSLPSKNCVSFSAKERERISIGLNLKFDKRNKEVGKALKHKLLQWNKVNTCKQTTLKFPGIITLIQLATVSVKFLLVQTFL